MSTLAFIEDTPLEPDNRSEVQLPSLPKDFRAVVIGATGGIGNAIATFLERQPNAREVVGLSRRDGMDILEEQAVAAHASQIHGPIHLLVCATGVLTVKGTKPEKSLKQVDPDIMLDQFRTNAIGPALVAKHFLPLLDRKTRSIAVFLSARVGSIGDNRLGGWISYRASKAALNQIVRTASIELSRTHPLAIVTAIHPGTVRTPLSEPYAQRHVTMSASQAAANILGTADSLKVTGAFVDYDGKHIEW